MTRSFTATAVASRASLTVHPGELAVVVAAEKARLEAQIAAAGMRRSGPWHESVKWARPVLHGWLRTPRRLATARVVRIECEARAL